MKVSSSSFLVAHKLANANINELEVPEEGYSISEFWYEDGDTVGPSIIEKLVISGFVEILENI